MARILVFAALMLSSLAMFASGAVIGVDMGCENIVLSTPGITDLEATDFNTVEIALNMQSHRKTANWIGFRNGERFFADDAMNLAARFPDLMTAAPHRFVGLLYNDTSLQSYMKNQHFPYTIKPHPTRGTVVFEYPSAGEGGATLTFTAEELLAMVFGHLKRTVEAVTRHNEPVSAAVVTVPQFFTERQRQAVIDAAALVGLRVLSLQHPPTAAAVQYGIQNDGFDGKPTTVAIVDMGAGATHVGIYKYGGVEAGLRKPRFNIGYGNLTALALVSSSEISGRVMDACVAKHIENDFVAKTGLPRILSGSTPAQRKSIIALMRAAKKVKETLTANRFALYTVEGMAPEKDFSSRMTREFFEEHCVTDAVAEVGKLIDRALEKAGQRLAVMKAAAVSSDDGLDKATMDKLIAAAKPLPTTAIDRLEVIGGGPRVLKILAELQSHTDKKVGRTMNSDEAIAVGVGYRAAGLSGVMRYKGFALQDASALSQSVSFSVAPLPSAAAAATTAAEESAIVPLFAAGQEKFLPARKIVSLGALQGDGALVSLIYTLASASSAGEVRTDRVVEVSGLQSALATVKYFTDFQRENNATHDVKIELSVSESGIISIDAASVNVAYAVNVTKTYKVPKKAANATTEGNATSAADDNNASAASADEAPKKKSESDASDSNKKDAKDKSSSGKKSAAPAADDKVEEETKTIVTIQRRKRTFPLTVAVTHLRSPLPLTLEDARKSKALLKKLDSKDEASFRLAATHNDLQSYMIWARGDGFDKYRNKLTAEEKASLAALLEETNTWVEDVATEDTPRSEVRAKLVVLRDEVRRLMGLTEDRADPSGADGEGEEESPFAAAPEPKAHSDDFIEDDGIRTKKAKKAATPVPPTDAEGSSADADDANSDVASAGGSADEDDNSATTGGEDSTEGEL